MLDEYVKRLTCRNVTVTHLNFYIIECSTHEIQINGRERLLP